MCQVVKFEGVFVETLYYLKVCLKVHKYGVALMCDSCEMMPVDSACFCDKYLAFLSIDLILFFLLF